VVILMPHDPDTKGSLFSLLSVLRHVPDIGRVRDVVYLRVRYEETHPFDLIAIHGEDMVRALHDLGDALLEAGEEIGIDHIEAVVEACDDGDVRILLTNEGDVLGLRGAHVRHQVRVWREVVLDGTNIP